MRQDDLNYTPWWARVVASLIDPRGEPYPHPRLRNIALGEQRIQAAVPSDAVKLMINHAVMISVARSQQPRSA